MAASMKLRIVALGHRMPAWVDAGRRRLREAPAARARARARRAQARAARPRQAVRAAPRRRGGARSRAPATARASSRSTSAAQPWTTRVLAGAARRAGATKRATSRSSSAAPTASTPRSSATRDDAVALSALTLPHGARPRHPRRAAVSRRQPHRRTSVSSRVTHATPRRGGLDALASISPRRARAGDELLRQLGVEFDDAAPARGGRARARHRRGSARRRAAAHYVERIARTKATIGWKRMLQRGLPPRPVLGADTEVVLDGVIFGKPRGRRRRGARCSRTSRAASTRC